MPWDSTKLYTADFSEKREARKAGFLIAGEDNESIAQPEWAPDGTLYFVSDRTTGGISIGSGTGKWKRFARARLSSLDRAGTWDTQPMPFCLTSR